MTAADDRSDQSRLAEAETMLEALRRQEVDAIVGDSRVLLLRLRETEQALQESEQNLRALNKTLEQRVAARTEALNRQTQRLRRLANELTEAEQQERKKLARTIHDGLQQILIGLQIHLAIFAMDGDPEVLEHAQKLLSEALQASRSLSYELAPPALYESDLPNALAWLISWFDENHRFHVTVDATENLPALSEPAKVFLFNATRELLLNCVKHSGVDAAVIRCIHTEENHLQIVVCDDGQGFEAAKLKDGLGLLSIRERLLALGGRLDIRSTPGEGAQFAIDFPLASEESGALRHRMKEAGVSAENAATHGAQSSDRRIRVLLADEHHLVCEGLKALLQQQARFDVVGEAHAGPDVIQLVEQTSPHVILMDIHLPRVNGFEATRRIKEEHPDIHVVGLSWHDEANEIQSMHTAGATTCISKKTAFKTLLNVLHNLYPDA